MVAIVLLIPHLTGCFQYVPVSPAAMPGGTEVSASVTDRGRVELTPVFGPGLRRVGGQVLETTDTSLVLSVTSVQYLDTNVSAPWDGQRVEFAHEFVTDLRERRLSRSRTLAATGLAVAVVVVGSLIAITGFGRETAPDPRPPPGNGEPQ